MPAKLRPLVLKHAELIKFTLVGGTALVVDAAIYYLLVGTVLQEKATIAKFISATIATIYSYFANTWFSFRNRGGLKRHQESLLFFLISGIGILIQTIPMFIVNNIWHIRSNFTGLDLKTFDFVINYIIANLAQMIFRFWALRKYAYPEVKQRR